MLVESSIGNLSNVTQRANPEAIDWLDLTWIECRGRFARKRTRAEREVRILLRLTQALRHNDILGTWPDGRIVVVNVLPAEVCVVVPKTPMELAGIVFQMGNLHLPIELLTDELVVVSGAGVEAAFDKLGIIFQSQTRLFQPTHWPDAIQFSSSFGIVKDR